MKINFKSLEIKKPVYTGGATLYFSEEESHKTFPTPLDAEKDIDPEPDKKGFKLPMGQGRIETVPDEMMEVFDKEDYPVDDPDETNRDNAFALGWLRARIAAKWISDTIVAHEPIQWGLACGCNDPRCWMRPEDDHSKVVPLSRPSLGAILDLLRPYLSIKDDEGRGCMFDPATMDGFDRAIDAVKAIIEKNWARFDWGITVNEATTWDEHAEKQTSFEALRRPPEGLAVAVRTGLISGTELTDLIDDEDAKEEWNKLASVASYKSLSETTGLRRFCRNKELMQFAYQFTRHPGLFPGEIRPGKIYRTRVGRCLANKGYLWQPAYVFVLPGECDKLGRYPAVMVERRDEASMQSPLIPYAPDQTRLFVDQDWSGEYLGCFGKVGYIDRAQIDEPVRDLIRNPLSDERIMELVEDGQNWALPEKAAPTYWDTLAIGECLLYRKVSELKPMPKNMVKQ